MDSNVRSLNIFTGISIVFWTTIIGSLLFWAIQKEEAGAIEYAKNEARANFTKDIAIRSWAASKGGVYVPVSEETPPNPYLDHIPERDIDTPSGKHLTLMNPAYMLRQTMTDFSKQYGVKGKITSLKPLNPVNASDEWEKRTLLKFEQGIKEVSEIETLDGKPHLRYMKVLIVKKTCLKCHQQQGYQEGDVRGGIGISVSLAPYLAIKNQALNTLEFSHGIIWTIGLLGIGFVNRQTKKRIVRQQEYEAALVLAVDHAEQKAETDGLTGLANRRFLNRQLDNEIRRAGRGQYMLSVLMLDIDFFKSLNDKHGHLAGDEALKIIAHTIKSDLHRPGDFVARFGGEEFVIVLPNTNINAAQTIAEDIRKKIEKLPMNYHSGKNIFVTVSIGIASHIPVEGELGAVLLSNADEALYKAKTSGRNRIVVAL